MLKPSVFRSLSDRETVHSNQINRFVLTALTPSVGKIALLTFGHYSVENSSEFTDRYFHILKQDFFYFQKLIFKCNVLTSADLK